MRRPLEFRGRKLYATDADRAYFLLQRKVKLRRRSTRRRFPEGAQQQFYASATSQQLTKLPPTEPVKMQVRCTKQLHSITVHVRGRITFHSHTREELRALQTLRALGDTTCGCLDLVKRIRTSELWRGAKAVFIKHVQPVAKARAGLDSQLSRRAKVQPRLRLTTAQRRIGWDQRVLDLLSTAFKRVTEGNDHYKGIKGITYGIADAEHPVGVHIVRREAYSAETGWHGDGMLALMVVPRTWLLQYSDKLHMVGGLLCTQFTLTKVNRTGVSHGRATVWARVGDAFMPRDVAVVWNGTKGEWNFCTPLPPQ